jgi:outer membrane protein assembly factor BamB
MKKRPRKLIDSGWLTNALRQSVLVILLLPAAVGAAGPATPDWPSFGGPNGDFSVDGKGLPATFAAGPPKRLWQRSLGDDGYSSIVTDGALLYTMYRHGHGEVVVAIDPATGATRWEYAYDAPFGPGLAMENGAGPHATPLVFGNCVYTIGVTANMHALDKKTGKLVWSKDLVKDFPGTIVNDRGYAVSPIAYKNTIIVKLGSDGHAIIALSPKDGSLVWQKQSFGNSPSSPSIFNVDGQDQLVTTFSDEVVGLDPNNGDLLWSYPHKTSYGLNVSTPLWGPGNLLFISSAYNGGAMVLHLAQSGGRTEVDEVWSSNRMRIHHSNAIRIGDYVYGSSGDFGPAPLTAVDIKTGKIAWQDRSFGKVNMVLVNGKVILLDEGGDLALATLSPEGLQVRWRVPLLQSNAWTAPTLVGTKLYVRDRRTIMALDFQ